MSDLASLVLVSMSTILYLHSRTDERNPQRGIYKVLETCSGIKHCPGYLLNKGVTNLNIQIPNSLPNDSLGKPVEFIRYPEEVCYIQSNHLPEELYGRRQYS